MNPQSLSALKIDYFNQEDNDERSIDAKKNNLVDENSELTIWKKIKNGDKEALGDLYNLYIDLLFSYGIKYSQDGSYVRDCIHDLFIDLYKYRQRLSDTDNVKYYLLKSLTRKINKKYKIKTIYFPQVSEYIDVKNQKNHTRSHEEEIIIKEHALERDKRLENALFTLTEKQREGIYLRFKEEKTYQEISEIMGITIQTARTTTYRAIKVLRKLKLNY